MKRGLRKAPLRLSRHIDYKKDSFYKQRVLLPCAPIAQLDRALDYESKGRKFESCWAHLF